MTASKSARNTRFTRHRRIHPFGLMMAVIIALFTCSLALAAPHVSVSNARIRLLPGDLPLAGYFDLTNRGDEDLVLVGASSAAFKMVHMHRSLEHGGTSSMVPVGRREIKPGATVHFSPGGYHLMLMQAAAPLKVGEKVPVALQFAGGQTLQVMFAVNGAGTE
ncbi:MAG TPA: copper chaperone PCu(A)C [Sulfuriferula sp.]|nr:copper chaperone PCu(A)C [Sulfuriferula sp.]